MNRHVNAIAGRLSLRPPQRRSLEMLDRITEIAPPRKNADAAALEAALEAIRSEFPSVTDSEREFPSLCFALATGAGKTPLMGAFISYLHLAHGINNFVLAKRKVAVNWCANASRHAAYYHGKPWRCVLIPHDAVAENITLSGLAKQFGG